MLYAAMLMMFPTAKVTANVVTDLFPVQKVMKLTMASSQPTTH